MCLENVTVPAGCGATFPAGGLTAASSLTENPAASPRVVMIWKSRTLKFHRLRNYMPDPSITQFQQSVEFKDYRGPTKKQFARSVRKLEGWRSPNSKRV